MTALPFEDTTDFENADRGFVAALSPAVVTGADGGLVYDNDAYAFLKADCPATAHPSLWRQAQLCSRQGLYEVTEGVYQIRGLDLSNMTLVEGERGVVVIDPLLSAETAAMRPRPLPRAPRRPPGHRHALHPLARRPLRRLPRRPAPRHRDGGADPRPGRLSWSTRSARTSTRATP